MFDQHKAEPPGSQQENNNPPVSDEVIEALAQCADAS